MKTIDKILDYFTYFIYILMGFGYTFLAFWINKETEFYGSQVYIGFIYLLKFSLLMIGILLFIIIYDEIKKDF